MGWVLPDTLFPLQDKTVIPTWRRSHECERHRHRHPVPDDQLRLHRLDDVAGDTLVLDHLRDLVVVANSIRNDAGDPITRSTNDRSYDAVTEQNRRDFGNRC